MALASPPNSIPTTTRLGGWLPADPAALNRWLAKTIDEAKKERKPYHPVVEEFQHMIESDPVMYMNFTLMFEQQPAFPPPPGSGDVKINTWGEFLQTKDSRYVLHTDKNGWLSPAGASRINVRMFCAAMDSSEGSSRMRRRPAKSWTASTETPHS